MKLLVFSDIHGSLPVARAILDLTEKHAPRAVLLLGDILYHGPRNPEPEGYNPKAVAEALRPLAPRIIAVKGNCDSEVDEMVLPFPLAPLFVWVLGEGFRLMATHGHILSPQNLPPLQQGDALLYGHTHVPDVSRGATGILTLNPGSLAMPKEDSPPCYGLLENKRFSVLTKEGTVYAQADL